MLCYVMLCYDNTVSVQGVARYNILLALSHKSKQERERENSLRIRITLSFRVHVKLLYLIVSYDIIIIRN